MKRRTILILLAVPVVAFVACEIIFRITEKPGGFPPLSISLTNDLPGLSREVKWSTDGYGMRRIGKEEGNTTVLCLGGESTMPLLQSDAASWWGRMQAKLAADGTEASIAATGINLGTISDCLRIIHQHADTIKPKVVVVALGPSEVTGRVVDFRFNPVAMRQTLPPEAKGFKSKILAISATARHVRLSRMESRTKGERDALMGVNAIRDRLVREHQQYLKAPEIPELPWIDDPADEVSEGLRILLDLSKQKGFKPVVVWLPWPYRPGMTPEAQEFFRFLTPVKTESGQVVAVRLAPGWVDGRMRAFRTRAQAVCEGLGIAFVDAASRIGDAPGIYFGDFQLTDAGADQVGAAVAPVVKAALTAP